MHAGAAGPNCCECCPGQGVLLLRDLPETGHGPLPQWTTLREGLCSRGPPPTQPPKDQARARIFDLKLHSSPAPPPSHLASPAPLPNPVPQIPILGSAPADPRLRPTLRCCQLTLQGTPLLSPSIPRTPCEVGILLTESREHFSISHPGHG